MQIEIYNLWNNLGANSYFEVNCTPIFEDGQVTKALCLARDITERKKIEELKKQAYESMKLLNETLEYDKVKTEFFSNLSHELRTPLNVILGTLQVMDMYDYQDLNFTAEKIKKYSKIMKQNCYRLLRLVNNLIDINKLDAGFMNLKMDNHDIVGIISNIASSVADYVESKGIGLIFESGTPSKIIACDPDKIERIILNLLSNAVKFTERGGLIQVRLWDEGESLFVMVKDDGIGIPKEKQDLVFKRFIQIEKSLSRVHQGSGIGLSLVKSLVELHGGSIRLVSEEGAGCEFTIELPIRQAVISEKSDENTQYASNNKIEVINIEFADIYS
jgi:signal transduction histidine kinase